MNALIYYRNYLAFSNHFNPQVMFDVSKYGFNTNAKTVPIHVKWQFNSLFKGKDINQREKLFRMYNVFKSSNFEYVTPAGFCCLLNRNRFDTIQEVQDEVVHEVVSIIEENILSKEGDLYPYIYCLYKDSKIRLETLLIVDKYIKKILTEEASIDILVWPNEIEKMQNIYKVLCVIFEDQEFVDRILAIASNQKAN